MSYAVFASSLALNYFKQLRANINVYLLNISFKLLAGKNLTFCDAAI